MREVQNGVRDLDLEDEVNVQMSRNFNWPYLWQFSMQNQNVWCSEIGSQMALSCEWENCL